MLKSSKLAKQNVNQYLPEKEKKAGGSDSGQRWVGIAWAGKYQLGFNISIKHSSVPSAGKNQSTRLNTELAVCLHLTAE